MLSKKLVNITIKVPSDLVDWIERKLSSNNKVKRRSLDVSMLELKDYFKGSLCLVFREEGRQFT